MTRDEARGYVEHWTRVGPLLEQIEGEELRSLNTVNRQRDIAALLDLAAQFAVPRTESGLQEQQRLFQQARE